MEDWTPAAPSQIDAAAFSTDIELVPLPGLWATFVFLAVGGALRGHGHITPRIVVIVLAIVTLVLTLSRSVRFNGERMRAHGHDYAWGDLLSVRSFQHRGARHLVLTFKTGVVATNSRMWRFGRLASFIGARLHQKSVG
jgi:hypothetical protein